MRQWKIQHAIVEQRLAAVLAAAESRQAGSSGGGGASRVPPMVGGAAGSPGSASRSTAERGFGCCAGATSTEGKNIGEGGEVLAAPPRGVSAGTAPDTTDALNGADGARAVREHHGGAAGGESDRSCGSSGEDEEYNDSISVLPGSTAVENSPGEQPPRSGVVRGVSGVETMPIREIMADPPSWSEIVAAYNGEIKEDINDSSPRQPLTFEQRRAVFSSNYAVPVTPAASSLPWSVVATTTVAAGKTANPTPSSPPSSLPRAGTRTSPPFRAFSSAAVEAACQNLKRSKLPSKRDSTETTRVRKAVAPGHLSVKKGEGEGEEEGGGEGQRKREGSCVPSDSCSSPQAVVSVSPVLPPQDDPLAACDLPPEPCSPPRPLHHRRNTAPSPPAPSPCSTADRHRATPGSPDSSSAGGDRSFGMLSSVTSSSSPWSSSLSSPAPPSAPSSPQLASPPSFPKPNAERRRTSARSAGNKSRTTASSSSIASAILASSATSGTTATAAVRLPSTAPSTVPCGSASPPTPAPAAAISGSSALTSAFSASPFAWRGTARRQKSIQLRSLVSASFGSAASSLPSPVPEESDIGAASAASRMAENGQRVTGSYHGTGGGGGGGRTTEEGFSNSKASPACPPGEAALPRTSFRGGGSGGGRGGSGTFDDDWKERSAGVGPWPLFEQTREGRASLEEKLCVRNGGANGTGTGTGRPSGGGVHHEAETPAVAAAGAAAAADTEVSIGNISTMQASRLRALREKMERRYWPRETSSLQATEAATWANPASNTNDASASANTLEGPRSLDRPARGDQSQVHVATPWGSRHAAEAHRATSSGVAQEQHGSRPLRNQSELFWCRSDGLFPT